jgi:hypothetical protein
MLKANLSEQQEENMKEHYRIFAAGDINAFFGLMLDNMSGLVIMATILMGAFQMPREINEQ